MEPLLTTSNLFVVAQIAPRGPRPHHYLPVSPGHEGYIRKDNMGARGCAVHAPRGSVGDTGSSKAPTSK